MTFENITKGKFIASYNFIHIDDKIEIFNVVKTKEDAEFIAYCFNLQQKLDIICYEDVIEAVEVLTKAKIK
jgi:hypothetical protein